MCPGSLQPSSALSSAPSSTLARPRLGWFDVSSLLVNFVTTTWAVEPERLARLLPSGIEPDTFTLTSGERTAFVSAVSFLNTEFFVGFAPLIRLCAPQTNYRAYVRCGKQRAAWFFRTQFDSFTVMLPRYLFGMPWFRSHIRHSARWDGDRLVGLEWCGGAKDGEERLKLTGTGEPIGVPAGFQDEAEAREVLTHPLIGYFRPRWGSGVGRYGVWHAPLELEHCQVAEARYEVFERLGLVAPGTPPTSVLAQRATQYSIFLPPHRLAIAM
jgi:hypothetical protein